MLAHPKVSTSKFPLLVLMGIQGSGKSFLATLIKRVIDPSAVSLQALPRDSRDLAVVLQQMHLSVFDNVRKISAYLSDTLCIASTGGVVTFRQLYSDSVMHTVNIHGAIIMTTIYSLLAYSDLMQRSIVIEMLALLGQSRRSESDILKDFEDDLPQIMAELFTLTSQILLHLPKVEATHSERMIDFVHWLAAMELVDGAPPGTYQAVYSEIVNQGQYDSLMNHVLAEAVIDFSQETHEDQWSGTPVELLTELDKFVNNRTKNSNEWPRNAIALSKRLKPLQAGLLSQGIEVAFSRGKKRTITIIKQEIDYVE